MRILCVFWLAFGLASASAAADDLSYHNYAAIPDQKFACLYAYAADKTGDHETALKILDGCIAAGSVWAMIWKAMLYENGQGLPLSLEKSAELMQRGAMTQDAAGYGALARYHWGLALYQGRGVVRDEAEGLRWLRQARDEGVPEAAEFLQHTIK